MRRVLLSALVGVASVLAVLVLYVAILASDSIDVGFFLAHILETPTPWIVGVFIFAGFWWRFRKSR